MAIHILETSFVKPVTPTKRHTLALCGLDLYWSAYGYARTLYFYRTQHDQFASIIRSLKRSLSAVLVDFYPVAGRLVEDPAGRLTLDCNDAGVEFIEACSDISFGQLEAMEFAVQDFFPALTRTKNRESKEDPIMSVQVTSFPGGGVAIGQSCDHTLFDGFSFASFMKCWAECCNGVPLSSPPCHMRKVGASLAEAMNATVLDDLMSTSKSSTYTATHSFDSLQGALKPEVVQVSMLALTADMVEKLKIDANDAEREGAPDMNGMKQAPFTSFVCLAAYLWKARTKADKQQSEDSEVALRFRVNIRARKLPATYFGPAVILAQVGPIKAGELRQESLGATAGRIHKAICAYTKEDTIRKELERYESGRVMYGVEGKKKEMMVVTEISDTRRVGFYDSEFNWGELSAFRPATTKGVGLFTLAPLPSGGGGSGHSLELILRLTTTELQGLLPCLLSDMIST